MSQGPLSLGLTQLGLANSLRPRQSSSLKASHISCNFEGSSTSFLRWIDTRVASA